ncbi:unnamed protein product [Amoebophrya sp. A25]|nr:unnamed protein product [Amoebophrya sp. A25]|eukprot:GSA25T00001167001.1
MRIETEGEAAQGGRVVSASCSGGSTDTEQGVASTKAASEAAANEMNTRGGSPDSSENSARAKAEAGNEQKKSLIEIDDDMPTTARIREAFEARVQGSRRALSLPRLRPIHDQLQEAQAAAKEHIRQAALAREAELKQMPVLSDAFLGHITHVARQELKVKVAPEDVKLGMQASLSGVKLGGAMTSSARAQPQDRGRALQAVPQMDPLSRSVGAPSLLGGLAARPPSSTTQGGAPGSGRLQNPFALTAPANLLRSASAAPAPGKKSILSQVMSSELPVVVAAGKPALLRDGSRQVWRTQHPLQIPNFAHRKIAVEPAPLSPNANSVGAFSPRHGVPQLNPGRGTGAQEENLLQSAVTFMPTSKDHVVPTAATQALVSEEAALGPSQGPSLISGIPVSDSQILGQLPPKRVTMMLREAMPPDEMSPSVHAAILALMRFNAVRPGAPLDPNYACAVICREILARLEGLLRNTYPELRFKTDRVKKMVRGILADASFDVLSHYQSLTKTEIRTVLGSVFVDDPDREQSELLAHVRLLASCAMDKETLQRLSDSLATVLADEEYELYDETADDPVIQGVVGLMVRSAQKQIYAVVHRNEESALEAVRKDLVAKIRQLEQIGMQVHALATDGLSSSQEEEGLDVNALEGGHVHDMEHATKPLAQWTEADVENWVRSLPELPQRETILEMLSGLDITGAALAQFDESKLETLGLENFGTRRHFALAIRELVSHQGGSPFFARPPKATAGLPPGPKGGTILVPEYNAQVLSGREEETKAVARGSRIIRVGLESGNGKKGDAIAAAPSRASNVLTPTGVRRVEQQLGMSVTSGVNAPGGLKIVPPHARGLVATNRRLNSGNQILESTRLQGLNKKVFGQISEMDLKRTQQVSKRTASPGDSTATLTAPAFSVLPAVERSLAAVRSTTPPPQNVRGKFGMTSTLEGPQVRPAAPLQPPAVPLISQAFAQDVELARVGRDRAVFATAERRGLTLGDGKGGPKLAIPLLDTSNVALTQSIGQSGSILSRMRNEVNGRRRESQFRMEEAIKRATADPSARRPSASPGSDGRAESSPPGGRSSKAISITDIRRPLGGLPPLGAGEYVTFVDPTSPAGITIVAAGGTSDPFPLHNTTSKNTESEYVMDEIPVAWRGRVGRVLGLPVQGKVPVAVQSPNGAVQETAFISTTLLMPASPARIAKEGIVPAAAQREIEKHARARRGSLNLPQGLPLPQISPRNLSPRRSGSEQPILGGSPGLAYNAAQTSSGKSGTTPNELSSAAGITIDPFAGALTSSSLGGTTDALQAMDADAGGPGAITPATSRTLGTPGRSRPMAPFAPGQESGSRAQLPVSLKARASAAKSVRRPTVKAKARARASTPQSVTSRKVSAAIRSSTAASSQSAGAASGGVKMAQLPVGSARVSGANAPVKGKPASLAGAPKRTAKATKAAEGEAAMPADEAAYDPPARTGSGILRPAAGRNPAMIRSKRGQQQVVQQPALFYSERIVSSALPTKHENTSSSTGASASTTAFSSASPSLAIDPSWRSFVPAPRVSRSEDSTRRLSLLSEAESDMSNIVSHKDRNRRVVSSGATLRNRSRTPEGRRSGRAGRFLQPNNGSVDQYQEKSTGYLNLLSPEVKQGGLFISEMKDMPAGTVVENGQPNGEVEDPCAVSFMNLPETVEDVKPVVDFPVITPTTPPDTQSRFAPPPPRAAKQEDTGSKETTQEQEALSVVVRTINATKHAKAASKLNPDGVTTVTGRLANRRQRR